MDVHLILASQTIFHHIFLDPELDHIFSYFWLCTWLIFLLFAYVVIVHLLQRREGVGIYCKFIPD